MIKTKITTLALLCAVSMVGCSKATEQETQTNTKEAVIQTASIKEEISLSGSLKANKMNSVSSPSKSEIQTIHITPNTDVAEGDTIITLENGVTITAPYDGKITKVDVYVGQSVDSSTTVFNIVDDSKFYIEASIDEADITKVSTDQEVEVNVSAVNKNLTGVIETIDAEASNSSFGIRISVDETEEENFENVFAGMSSELNIIIKEASDVLVAPIQAVTSRKGISTVNLKSGEVAEVEVGISDSSFVEIVSGLSEGDVITYTQASSSSQMINPEAMFGGGQMPEGFDKTQMKEMMGGGMGRPDQMGRPSN